MTVKPGPLVIALVLCLAVEARAAVVGSIFSGPTSADGASTYWNPAAMTLSPGTHGMLFGAVAPIRLHYQRDTVSAFDNQPFPQANVLIYKPGLAGGVVTDATLKDLRLGFGASLPIIDGATWDLEYEGRPSSTRYYAERARLIMFKLQPTVAYRIADFIAVGVGLDIIGVMLEHQVMTDFGAKINQLACSINPSQCMLDAPLAREDPSLDGKTRIEGMGWGVGVTAGVLITPVRWLRLGVGFHSGAPSVKIPVDLSVEVPLAALEYLRDNLPSVKVPELTAEGEVETTAPMIFTAGIGITPIRPLELKVDMHWINYSSTAVMIGNVENSTTTLIGDQVLIKARNDALLTGLQANYSFPYRLTGALRFEYDRNTNPDLYASPVSIDFHRLSLHLGGAWQATRHLMLTLEYSHYFILDRTITASRFGPSASPTTPEEQGFDKPPPTGRYFVEADRVGLGVLFSF